MLLINDDHGRAPVPYAIRGFTLVLVISTVIAVVQSMRFIDDQRFRYIDSVTVVWCVFDVLIYLLLSYMIPRVAFFFFFHYLVRTIWTLHNYFNLFVFLDEQTFYENVSREMLIAHIIIIMYYVTQPFDSSPWRHTLDRTPASVCVPYAYH